MSRLPQQPTLAMNMQLPVCDSCMQRGTIQHMRLIVGRDFENDFGNYWYQCDRCERLDGAYTCPLWWLSASSLSELNQLRAYESAGIGKPIASVKDLSPGAKEILETFGMNPLVLAERAAEIAMKRAQAEQRAAEAEERLADSQDS